MKFATVSTLRASSQPAIVVEDRVHTLPYADMHAVIAAGAEKAASRASKEALSFEEVTFHSPIYPTTLRDAYAFEQHVATAHRNRGRDVPLAWYEIPVFYFGNHTAIYGPDADVPMPRTKELLAEPPMAPLEELRRRIGPQLSDEEFLLRAVMPAGQVDAMLAAGPAPRHYDPTLKPVMTLLRDLAARRDLSHVTVEKPGFRLELRRCPQPL